MLTMCEDPDPPLHDDGPGLPAGNREQGGRRLGTSSVTRSIIRDLNDGGL